MLNQSELVNRILKALGEKGLLENLIVVGSWCIYFYKHHFKEADVLPPIRTRDIEFDVSLLRKAPQKIDMSELFKELDFEIDFQGEGFIRFLHPSLIIEFLVPERGKGSSEPFKLPGFGINAIPLRYLSLLEEEIITINYYGLPVKVPHPANFAIHKLIVAQDRKKPDKSQKDKEQAVAVWDMLVEMGEIKKLGEIFSQLPKGWKKYVNKSLSEAGRPFFTWGTSKI